MEHSEIKKKVVPTIQACARKWVRMTDDNSKGAMNWYKACAKLSRALEGDMRDEFTSALIENIKLSSDDYFRNSKRPLTTLSVIEREMGRIVEGLMYPPEIMSEIDINFIEGKSRLSSGVNSYNPFRMDYDSLVKTIWVVATLTIILTVVILFIMCLYCIQYKKFMDRKKIIESVNESGTDYGKMCHCGKRIWDTGEPSKKRKQNIFEDTDISEDEPYKTDESVRQLKSLSVRSIQSKQQLKEQKKENVKTKKK